MRQMTVTALTGASVLALALAAPAAAQNVFRWTSQGDALTMDPHSANEGPTIAMTGQIYETLVTRDPDLKLQPELATSWEGGEDGWVFQLREGVTFQNGAKFTAEDVAFSIERAQADSSDFKEQLTSVSNVEVIDDHTVKLVTDSPNPILPNEITTLYMMDKDWSEENDVAEPQDFAAQEETYSVRNANGTGPFKLVSRAPDESTVLEAHEDWWGTDEFPGNLDRIEYRPIGNAATRVATLLSGEVDFILDPPLQDLERIESTDGLHVKTVAQIRSIFLGMNQGLDELATSDLKGENPFKDPKVRMAFNLAIDKEAIKRVVMEGLSFPTGLITPPGVFGNTPELDESYGFDVEKAKSLMEEAGYGDGFSVQLDCPNNRYNNDEKICQAAVSMLAKIGVEVSLAAVPKAQHFPKITNQETDFYMLGWGVPTLDSGYVFDYLVKSDASWNATGYSNEKVDELAEQAATELDEDKRAEQIDEAWHIFKEDAPYVPLHHQVIAWGVSDKFEVPIGADDALRPRFIVAK